MGAFYFLSAVLCISSLFCYRSKKWGFFILILLLFFNIFRGINVGSDTVNYYTNHIIAEDFSFDSGTSYGYEFMFILLGKTINKMDLNPRWCLWFLSIVTFFFLYQSYRRYNKKYGVSLVLMLSFYFLLSFYALSLNIARQMAAVSIILYAYSYYEERGYKKHHFFFYTLLACSLHLSSVIILVVCLLNKMKFRLIVEHKYFVYITLIGMFVIIQVFKTFFLSSALSSLNILNVYTYLAEETESSTISVVGMFFKVLEMLIFLKLYYSLNKFAVLPSKILFIAIVFEVLLGAFYGINRIGITFSIIKIVCLSLYFSRPSKNRIIYLALFMILFGYPMLSSLSNGAYDIVPYYLTL